MRVLFIGDIVGQPGVALVRQCLAPYCREESIQLVVANGENADAGSGITPSILGQLRSAGVHCVTLGDHAFRRRDILDALDSRDDIVRPANWPAEAPGRGWTIVPAESGTRVAVINLIGRVFMKPADCPFHTADRILDEIPADIAVRIVDFHAEATSDKQLMGRYLDGRVSAVIGTHTHVPTADEHIRPGGTAFICDVGMTGPHDSILGRSVESVMETTLTFRPRTFHVASDDVRLSAALIDIDGRSGLATAIRRVTIDEQFAARLAEEDLD